MQYRLGANLYRKELEDSGGQVDYESAVYCCMEIKANHTISFTNKSIANGLKEIIVSLCLVLERPHLEYCAIMGLLSTRY